MKEQHGSNFTWIIIVLIVGVICFSNPFILRSTGQAVTGFFQDNVGFFQSNVGFEDLVEDNFSNTHELHWGHMPITYRIDDNCVFRLANSTRLAFEKIRNETDGLVSFEEVFEDPDIAIHCKSQILNKLGEGAIADATFERSEDNDKIIVHGEINIYGQGANCNTGYPTLEVHEILHLFDIKHNPKTRSIMSPFFSESSRRCKIENIDEGYISCLKNIYSNGTLEGNCSDVDTITSLVEEKSYCEDGYYEAEGALGCCPEPNMTIVEDHCEYSNSQ